jgi:hypothetical protein
MGTDPSQPAFVKKLGFLETVQSIIAKDGIGCVLRFLFHQLNINL